MELWIRSQDKEELVKISGTRIDYLRENEIIGYVEYDGSITLGIYATKERALEVLDEIENLLKPKVLLNSGKIIGSFENTIYKEPDKIEIQELSVIVYEMPKV